MRNRLVSVVALALILGLSAEASADPINIAISPQTVNLQFQGEWVTVHADIPYTSVVPDSVLLDKHFPADIEKADDRGDLVAKFKMTKDLSEYLRGFLDEGSATLTLTGETTVGDGSFSGSDNVRVIDQAGKRSK